MIENQEISIRFNKAEELLMPETKKGFGERLISIFVFANEGQKMGAIAYASRSRRSIGSGNYLILLPIDASTSQILITQKQGLVGIRYYPAIEDFDSEKILDESIVLTTVIKKYITSCKEE
ncbi:MAG: hypothetical protein WKG03_07375 [Telluria sp.]